MISGVMSPLISWVMSIGTLPIILLITTQEPPSRLVGFPSWALAFGCMHGVLFG